MTQRDGDQRLEPALDALLRNDVADLRSAIAAEPGVVALRTNDGDTLLELTTQPCFVPPSGEVIDVLAENGAELDRALNLAACWNLAAMCERLLAHGADPTARADAGITPLESSALHSSAEAADVVVTQGIHRRALWLAAAAGQLSVVQNWVGPGCSLLAPPGPTRPDWSAVGRPAGAPPTDDPTEVVGEAFVFAAFNGRKEVADYLLEVGADIDARPYRNTTALHFAIQFGRLEMVRHLIALGASTTIADDTFGGDAKGWAQACDDGSEQAAEIREVVGATSG